MVTTIQNKKCQKHWHHRGIKKSWECRVFTKLTLGTTDDVWVVIFVDTWYCRIDVTICSAKRISFIYCESIWSINRPLKGKKEKHQQRPLTKKPMSMLKKKVLLFSLLVIDKPSKYLVNLSFNQFHLKLIRLIQSYYCFFLIEKKKKKNSFLKSKKISATGNWTPVPRVLFLTNWWQAEILATKLLPIYMFRNNVKKSDYTWR